MHMVVAVVKRSVLIHLGEQADVNVRADQCNVRLPANDKNDVFIVFIQLAITQKNAN